MTSTKLNVNECTDTAELWKALESAVHTRNQMGGAMWWNVLNDEACAIGRRLLELGEDRAKIGEVIGAGNYR